MSPMMKLFAKEYLVDLCGADAAIRAGYSPRTAAQKAYELMQNPEVKALIEAGMKEREERTGITADYVLGNLQQLAERCMSEEDFQPGAAAKALELLGKHLKLFTDKVEGKTDGSITLRWMRPDEVDDGD